MASVVGGLDSDTAAHRTLYAVFVDVVLVSGLLLTPDR